MAKKDVERYCFYCGVVQGIKISSEHGNFHMCEVTNRMTPFVPNKRAAKNKDDKDVQMVSYGQTSFDADPMMGAPTRGRG